LLGPTMSKRTLVLDGRVIVYLGEATPRNIRPEIVKPPAISPHIPARIAFGPTIRQHEVFALLVSAPDGEDRGGIGGHFRRSAT